MKKIGFSGTLDPITNGHMWVISEARLMADEVIVFISENLLKKNQFSAQKRKKIIELSALQRGWDNISVVIVRGNYTARVAKNHHVDYLIRGIRNTADFDYENLIQQTNVDVLDGAKTIFVMPPRDLGSVSSSFIRALQGPVGWHWLTRNFVPAPAYDAWILNWLRNEWDVLWQGQPALAGLAANWFDYLTGSASYGSTERHYHNLDHLVHGLTEINAWAANADAETVDINELKQAFWFHDAIHGQNEEGISDEEASARLWLTSGLATVLSETVASLIRITDRFQQISIIHPLKDIMLSTDLAILGQSEEVYDAYTVTIRAEYRKTPDPIFYKNRLHALKHLRQKAQVQKLYVEPYFAEQYNEKAIDNMTREIIAIGLRQLA